MYSISYVPGKDLNTADTLSRALVMERTVRSRLAKTCYSIYIEEIVNSLPESEYKMQKMREEQKRDKVFQQLKWFCQERWPDKSQLKGPIKAYVPMMTELDISKGLLLRANRLVTPSTLCPDILRMYIWDTRQ